MTKSVPVNEDEVIKRCNEILAILQIDMSDVTGAAEKIMSLLVSAQLTLMAFDDDTQRQFGVLANEIATRFCEQVDKELARSVTNELKH